MLDEVVPIVHFFIGHSLTIVSVPLTAWRSKNIALSAAYYHQVTLKEHIEEKSTLTARILFAFYPFYYLW